MIRVLVRSVVALLLFILLVAARVGDHYPNLPNPLVVDLLLEPGEPGRSDPLIVAGVTGAADFLCVRFDDARTVRFYYDSWAEPGLVSDPVAISPGEPLRLEIQLPALDQVRGSFAPWSNRLRLLSHGRPVFETTVHFFLREPSQVFFGENPLGGTACGPVLHGRMTTPGGRLLRGGPGIVFSPRERLRDWLAQFPRQIVTLLVFSVGLVFFFPNGAALARTARATGRLAWRHRWFAAAAAAATLGYTWLVTLGSFQFNHAEIFGSFYDYQAASFLQGRLDVPEDAIGGEAFEARGKLYGYFGPTPALLRLPFALSGFAFGKLSRAFMVGYFVASLLAAYCLLREATRRTRGVADARPPDDSDLPSPFATLVLVGSAGLGSTLFFLGSRGLIFHEAILGGIAFALGSCACALRYLRAPQGRGWLGALACGVLSLHTRPPTGLFALTFLGLVALALAWREGRAVPWKWTPGLRRHVLVGVLCALGFLSLNAFAWLKFRTFDAAPLRISRPYQTPGRLEAIDGRSFHLANIPYNVDVYLLRPNFRVESGFPWIYQPSRTPGRAFPHAKIDLPDHTLALPYAMPSLFLLATLGCAGAFLALPATRLPVALLWLAVLPMAFALFAAIATAQRYTGDFCPFLICAAAFGLAAAERTARWIRALLCPLVALATLAAIAVTGALTLHYQGEVLWGVPEPTRHSYQQLRRTVDGFFGHRPDAHP